MITKTVLYCMDVCCHCFLHWDFWM